MLLTFKNIIIKEDEKWKRLDRLVSMRSPAVTKKNPDKSDYVPIGIIEEDLDETG